MRWKDTCTNRGPTTDNLHGVVGCTQFNWPTTTCKLYVRWANHQLNSNSSKLVIFMEFDMHVNASSQDCNNTTHMQYIMWLINIYSGNKGTIRTTVVFSWIYLWKINCIQITPIKNYIKKKSYSLLYTKEKRHKRRFNLPEYYLHEI